MDRPKLILRVCILVGCLGVLTAIGLLAWRWSGHMPNTLRFDENGFPHGTGWQRSHYKSGALKLEEYYVAGQLELSRWFRPDGSLVAETDWQDECGVGYYLREDGSIKCRMEYVNGYADGTAVYYDEEGAETHRVEFDFARKTKTVTTASSPAQASERRR